MTTVYRDEKHAAVRAMGVDGISTCARAAWQAKYQANFMDGVIDRSGTESLSVADRLSQDAMTRAMMHRILPEPQWLALLAMYSRDDAERKRAVLRLEQWVGTNAGPLYRRWCVSVWALPQLRRGARQVNDWDGNGTPDRTLRDWKKKIHAQLDTWCASAFAHLERVLEEAGLTEGRQH